MPNRRYLKDLAEKLRFLASDTQMREKHGLRSMAAFSAALGERHSWLKSATATGREIQSIPLDAETKLASLCGFDAAWPEWRKGSLEAFQARLFLEGAAQKTAHTPDSQEGDEATPAPPTPQVNPDVKKWDALKAAAVEELVKLLADVPETLAYVKRQPTMEQLPLTKRPDGSIDLEAIKEAAEFLLDATIDDVIPALGGVFSDLRRENSDPRSTAIRSKVVAVAQRIVPALCQDHCIANIVTALGDKIGGLIELPIHHRTVAEIMVAAAEGRSTSYLSNADPGLRRAGTGSFIDNCPDCGYDVEDQRAKDVISLITSPYSAKGMEELANAIKRYAAGSKFYEANPTAAFSDDQKLHLVGKTLSARMKQEKRRFYIMFYPNKKDDLSSLANLVDKLNQHLPGMLFLALSEEFSIADAEAERFASFGLMLSNSLGDQA